MATFLFVSIPVAAHSTNPMPFAARLVERGHRVLWLSGAAFHEQLVTTGAEPVPYSATPDFSDGPLEEHFPQFAGVTGLRAIRMAFAQIFVGLAAQRVADIAEILEREPVDAMLTDGPSFGVGLSHELGGPVWATYGDGPLAYEDADTPPFGPALSYRPGVLGRLRNRMVRTLRNRVVFREAVRVDRDIRRRLGAPTPPSHVLDQGCSPYLHLQGCTPAFEYPRRALPGHIHWVGALRPDPRPWDPPDWWPEVTGARRPVVFVSQGSMRADLAELAVPAVRGLAGEDVLVVVVTGAADSDRLADAHGGATLPANVRVARFIPYDEVMPHARVFVTNGGYTGVTLALAHGVPLVQVGATEEKPEIAARIAYAGVGVTLGATASPDALRDAVGRVLTEPGFADAADRVRAQMAEHNAGREGAVLLERLAATGRPVVEGFSRNGAPSSRLA